MDKKRPAFALIVVLVLSTIIIALSLFLIKVSKRITTNIFLFQEKVQSDILLQGFISKLLFELTNCKLTCNSCVSEANIFFLDGREMHQKYQDATIDFSIRDVRSLIFLRNPPTGLLKNLFANLGNKNHSIMVDSLLDWLDPDNIPLPNGAECSFYRKEGKYYCPRNNRAIQHRNELLDIRGYSKKSVRDISQYVTIYSDGLYNINTIAPKILEAWPGVSRTLATEILQMRKTRCLRTSDFPILRHVPYSSLLTNMPLKIFKIKACCSYGRARTCAEFVVDYRNQKPEILEFQYLF